MSHRHPVYYSQKLQTILTQIMDKNVPHSTETCEYDRNSFIQQESISHVPFQTSTQNSNFLKNKLSSVFELSGVVARIGTATTETACLLAVSLM